MFQGANAFNQDISSWDVSSGVYFVSASEEGMISCFCLFLFALFLFALFLRLVEEIGIFLAAVLIILLAVSSMMVAIVLVVTR